MVPAIQAKKNVIYIPLINLCVGSAYELGDAPPSAYTIAFRKP